MTGPDPEKARRYIASLDSARCQDRWDEVPELIRKVTKHAPQKKCYIETAKFESQIVAHIKQRPLSSKSSTSFPPSHLTDLIPSLLSTIEKADGSSQEVFQAQVCLGWIHWTLNEPKLAVARLPKDIGATVRQFPGDGQSLSPWTEVCLVKGCYIKGTGQSMLSGPDDALSIFNTLYPWVNSLKNNLGSSPELGFWAENFLAKGALLASEVLNAEVALRFFRLWSTLPETKQVPSPQASHTSGPDHVSRLDVWKSYYDILSLILRGGLEYHAPADGPARPQLALELRRVQSIYETCLLREVKFPTASGTNDRIEAWVEQVIQNWEILCGALWRDDELGDGGQSTFTRNVLDILYRAATKTYHSHLILRRLFHVHAALAEFDLALKALDSYVEIVTGAKDRADQSAEYGVLENDGIFLKTISEALFLLSLMGSLVEAEKAKGLTELLRRYMAKHVPSDGPREISPTVIATAYRAIGTALANWANWTPVNEARDDIRADAIEYLERSLEPELQDESNHASRYTLALLLAENRELDAAIDIVKPALTEPGQNGQTSAGDISRDRDLVPLWHLLALLLSAKGEFEIAERSCEAAFEQFPRAVTLFSQQSAFGTRPLQHVIDKQDLADATNTLLGKLRGREKEQILEVRMTQLALVELVEGPEAALNHSSQLLRLFAVLFKDLKLEDEDAKSGNSDGANHPKTADTMRSYRGSVLGRQKGARPLEQLTAVSNSTGTASPVNSDRPDSTRDTPSVHVTLEDGEVATERPQSVRRTASARKLRKRSASLRRTDPPRSEPSDVDGIEPNGNRPTSAHSNAVSADQHASPDRVVSPEAAGAAVSEGLSPADQEKTASQPLQTVPHNMKYNKAPQPVGHEKQPPMQDVRLPTTYRFISPTAALTRFPMAQSLKHALGMLVKIWLLIAGLYRRASLFEDAHEACEEAAKHAARVEKIVSNQDPCALALSKRGWGPGKSSDELWADIYAERGLISQAQSRPHDALEQFEEALLHFRDHPKATVALANLLLDIFDQKMTSEPPQPSLEADISLLRLSTDPAKSKAKANAGDRTSTASLGAEANSKMPTTEHVSVQEDEPKFLNRLAARDRAYGLLSALTKLGSSWDNSEAWYALARAYEAGEQIEKLRDVLWWCIELEDSRPIRHWSNIGSNVYVL